ncbi:hypothetical protein FZEAL_4594 [Fusarium zealandicum]|uniref:Trichodiene oxygenase n=1 Tax=Fusarium zealandicum TaxID=1053134 RepID=A0A8H4XLA6_9HYPO|nr:hypothetical protein FZEAL_4594 [Fusarium zealandicum]
MALFHLLDPAGLAWQDALLSLAFYLAIFLSLRSIFLAVYRVTLHPLAKFPGPKLAAASYLYEFWFDVVCWGRYTWKIIDLHAEYGPIIRINPNELHCADPGFVDVIYSSGRSKRDKSKHYVSAFPIKLRRSAVSRHFTRPQVQKLESLVHRGAQKLCDKLLAYRGRGPFEGAAAFSCFTTDTISEYCFGSGTMFLDQDGWEPNYKDPINMFFHTVHIFRHLRWTAYLVDFVPLSVVTSLSRGLGSFMHAQVTLPEWIQHTIDTSGTGHGQEQPSVIREMWESKLPAEEKEIGRLTAEAISIMIGGTETTATVLCVVTFHLLSKPALLERLRVELSSIVTDPLHIPRWSELEKLPFLSATILEGLRLMYGSSQRLPRIAPDEDLMYTGSWSPKGSQRPTEVAHTIPRGYAIGMSSFIMHSDESIFPNAFDFVPERWLHDSGERNKELERYLLSFAKGSRQCVGMQLAYCELYVTITALVLRVMPHLELYQTDISDIAYDHDEIKANAKRGSKGLRLVVVE